MIENLNIRSLNRRMIDKRPIQIENRQEAGHTIIGKNHKCAIITNVERKSAKLMATKVRYKAAQAILKATVLDFKNLPVSLRISIRYDNGKEF